MGQRTYGPTFTDVSRANVTTKKLLTVEGIPELQTRINKLLFRLQSSPEDAKRVKKAYMLGALVVRDYARSIAPVGPPHKQNGKMIEGGAFKRSIFAAYGKDSAPNVLIGCNFDIAPHAWLVEFGGAKNRPHHTLRSAIVAKRAEAVHLIGEELRKVIQELAEK